MKQFLFSILAIFMFLNICRAQISQEIIIGKLSDTMLSDVSGIAPSRLHKNLFYVHNDRGKGDGSRFYAIASTGELKAIWHFEGDVTDCEDIAIGPGPRKNRSYIYLADIGDNESSRPSIKVYRFEEPAALPENASVATKIKGKAFILAYPDGPRDAETIMIDPIEKLLYIISKREDSVGIYTASLRLNGKRVDRLKKEGKIYFEGKPTEKWITSGDISPDGRQILIRAKDNVYYWRRHNNEPIHRTLQNPSYKYPGFIARPRQEAIAFSNDGKGFYVAAEGRFTPIYYYVLE